MSLQTRKSSRELSSTHILYSSPRKQNSNSQHGLNSNDTNKRRGRTLPFMNYIKTATNKVAGFLTILFLPRRKATDVIIDTSKSSSLVKGISCKLPFSFCSIFLLIYTPRNGMSQPVTFLSALIYDHAHLSKQKKAMNFLAVAKKFNQFKSNMDVDIMIGLNFSGP